MKLIRYALMSLAVGTAWSLVRQAQARRPATGHKVKPEAVHTWEGEGGALPTTGAQMGPDPVVPATSTGTPSESVGAVH